MKIRELTEMQQRISDMLEENDGDITEEIADMIMAAESNEKDMCDWFGTMCAQAAADSDALSEELKRIFARKKTTDNKRKRLLEYYLTHMTLAGLSKVEGALYKTSIRSSKAVTITDEASLIGDAAYDVEQIRQRYPWLNIKIDISKTILKDMEEMPEGAEIEEHVTLTFR